MSIIKKPCFIVGLFTFKMSIVNKYIQRLTALKKDLPKITRLIIAKNQQGIISYYQDNQIGAGKKKGTRKDSVGIGWYAEGTQDTWMRSSSYDPSMDKGHGVLYYMQWTGDFFSGMYLYFPSETTYAINSTDGKTNMLLAEYGDLFTFTDITRKEVERLFIEKDFNSEFNKRIGAIV